MTIIHQLNDFLFTLFPELIGGGNDLIVSELQKYYSYGPFKPKVTIEDNWVTVEIDTSTILSQESDYRKVIDLCERGKFTEAKPILQQLIVKNPSVSEYHRILGQILSDEGDQDEAINCLIDALRWDSKNGFALLMMGNVLVKHRKDVASGLKYYNQAIKVNKADVIALSNVAYLLMQENQLEEAKKYAYLAQKENADYPNTSFILGLIAKMENDLHSAFYSMSQVLKISKSQSQLTDNALNQVIEIAYAILKQDEGKKICFQYRSDLEKQGKVSIDIYADDTIQTAAKIEFAERHHREKHIVKYKSKYKAVEHLIMHELVHLDFVIQARNKAKNKVFLSTKTNKTAFLDSIAPSLESLLDSGVPSEAVDKFADGLFNGINLQTYNTPIDVFIEDFLYNTYPELRPYQFLSLYNLLLEGKNSVTDKKILEVAPPEIVSKTKIFSLINALQFHELFGIEMHSLYKATLEERELANRLYQKFTALRATRAPGQEFDLVNQWAHTLQLDAFFELEDETTLEAQNDIDAFLSKIEQDPYGLNEEEDPEEKAEMEQFQKHQEAIGTNPAIILFISEALQYFKNKTQAEIKATAFEIAQLGMTGIDPNKKDYIIGSMKGKRFSGNQVLAMMYTSWKLALPDQVGSLGLPFEKEYEMAKGVL